MNVTSAMMTEVYTIRMHIFFFFFVVKCYL